MTHIQLNILSTDSVNNIVSHVSNSPFVADSMKKYSVYREGIYLWPNRKLDGSCIYDEMLVDVADYLVNNRILPVSTIKYRRLTNGTELYSSQSDIAVYGDIVAIVPVVGSYVLRLDYKSTSTCCKLPERCLGVIHKRLRGELPTNMMFQDATTNGLIIQADYYNGLTKQHLSSTR